MQSDILPEPIKSTLQSAATMAQGAAQSFTTSLPGLAHTYHHDDQKPPADAVHRNAGPPETVHTRAANAPRDLGEFMKGQLEGKIDDAKLAEQFPTRGGMWHGFIDVSASEGARSVC